jgi:hypothetical protein
MGIDTGKTILLDTNDFRLKSICDREGIVIVIIEDL